MKFFFIRDEIIPIAMIFRELDKIEKEEHPIPKGANWYMNLLAKPNRIFGENVLVAAQMGDKWPETSEEVLVLQFNSEGVLHDLGINQEERPKKAPKKKASKKVTVARHWCDQ
ncbi:hypothetical protein Hdeb2414_s0021g00576541 [Helianthus debilis subsp. tardiflorus]